MGAMELLDDAALLPIKKTGPIVVSTDALVEKIETPFVEVATVISKNLHAADILNPNVVKAFINEKKEIIDFKRNILDSQIGGAYRHIGLYGYKRDTLMRFTKLEKSQNELAEKLEQLRAIDNGIKINAIIFFERPNEIK